MAQIVHPLADYKVATVGPMDTFSFDGSDGNKVTLNSYSLQLDGISEWVKLSLKPEADAPQPLEVIRGHIEDNGKYGFKFVKERTGGSFGGGGKKNFAGAAYANAVQTASGIVASYYALKDEKPKDIQEFMSRVAAVTPMVKNLVDKLAGESAPAEAAAPAPAPAAPAAQEAPLVSEEELKW